METSSKVVSRRPFYRSLSFRWRLNERKKNIVYRERCERVSETTWRNVAWGDQIWSNVGGDGDVEWFCARTAAFHRRGEAVQEVTLVAYIYLQISVESS